MTAQGFSTQLSFSKAGNTLVSIENAELEGLSFANEWVDLQALDGKGGATRAEPYEFSLILSLNHSVRMSQAHILNSWFREVEHGTADLVSIDPKHEGVDLKVDARIRFQSPGNKWVDFSFVGVFPKAWAVTASNGLDYPALKYTFSCDQIGGSV